MIFVIVSTFAVFVVALLINERLVPEVKLGLTVFAVVWLTWLSFVLTNRPDSTGYSNYLTWFSDAQRILTSREPIFGVISHIVSRLTDDVRLLYGILGLISLACYYFAVNRLKLSPTTKALFFLYYFVLIFHQSNLWYIRQGTAVAIFLVSIIFWEETKRTKSLVVILVATAIHFSAFFAFVVFLTARNIPVKALMIGTMVVALIFLWSIPVFEDVSKLLNRVIPIAENYTRYQYLPGKGDPIDRVPIFDSLIIGSLIVLGWNKTLREHAFFKFALSLFLVRFLSYEVQQAGRILRYVEPVFVLLIAFSFPNQKKNLKLYFALALPTLLMIQGYFYGPFRSHLQNINFYFLSFVEKGGRIG